MTSDPAAHPGRSAARLRLVRRLRRARGAAAAPILGLATTLARRPTRLVIAPPDLRTADASIASDILAGHYVFGGKAVVAPSLSPFAVSEPSPAWARALYGFVWLRHLKTLDAADARAAARTLVGDFIAVKTWPRIAAQPKVMARRLISLVGAAPYLLDGADAAYYYAYLGSLVRHARLLRRAVSSEWEPLTRLNAGIALLHLALSTDRSEKMAARAIAIVSRELDAQIAADGGHIGRNPETPVELLFDLIPLRQCFVRRGLEPPDGMLNAIDRMLAMVRHLRHADGALAAFNGAGGIARDQLATLIAYGDAGYAGAAGLRGGYGRLVAMDTVVIVDAAPAGPIAATSRAHAGCLSFEFSSEGQRWVVNCAAPRDDGTELGEAVRTTIAHSTATLGNLTSAEFVDVDSVQLLVGPPDVRAETTDDGLALDAIHEGYAERFGASHMRRFALDGDGARLRGRDDFPGEAVAEGVAVALRFHLHPTIEARLSDDDTWVLLTARDGAEWRFWAEGSPLEIEDSIYLGDGAPRRTLQIVARFSLDDRRGLAWTFERLTRGRARSWDDEAQQ